MTRTAKETDDFKFRISRLYGQNEQMQDLLGCWNDSSRSGIPQEDVRGPSSRCLGEPRFAAIELNNARLAPKGNGTHRIWIEWYKNYVNTIASKSELPNEQKRKDIANLVELVGVRFDKTTSEYERLNHLPLKGPAAVGRRAPRSGTKPLRWSRSVMGRPAPICLGCTPV